MANVMPDLRLPSQLEDMIAVTGSKLYCSVTEACVCVIVAWQWNDRWLNVWRLGDKCSVVPIHHQVTGCVTTGGQVTECVTTGEQVQRRTNTSPGHWWSQLTTAQ